MKYEGKPCRKCGNTIRYIKSNACTDCSIKRALKWRADHPDRARASDRKAIVKYRSKKR